jgi:hypothetical protein
MELRPRQSGNQFLATLVYEGTKGPVSEFLKYIKRHMLNRVTKESNLLKQQFDELVHDESVAANSIEEIFDIQFRRRFAELITQTARVIAQPFITGRAANKHQI